MDFRYILKSNQDVEIAGTVTFPEDEDAPDEEIEIMFDRAGNTPTPNLFVNHYGVVLQATEEQNFEIDKLKQEFCDDFLFLQRIGDYAEGGNTIQDLGEVYLVINGADFETWVGDHP